MKEAFKAVKVTDKVYWVGAVDWAVRDFHGYQTGRGTTYNSYLVLADRIALLDAVKAPFKDEMMARIASIVDPKKIEIIVSNHAEPDHTGALGAVIEAIKPQKVLASTMGVKALEQHYHGACGATAVKDGEKLSLGNVDLTFADTRMCHWPDSMVCYLHQERMLVSQDAFGMHLATYERFDDQLSAALLDAEAAKYYANILLPFSNFIGRTIEKLAATGWALDIIAPDHGPVWRKDPQRIVALYARWATQPRTNKGVVVYDTMWQSTDLMARAIGEGLAAGGTATRLMPLSGTHRSDIATELLDAGAFIVGAPTLNNQVFPTLADVMTYIRGLAPRGLIGATFGSYGWSGEAPKGLRATLEEMKVEMVGEPARVAYVPAGEDLKRCYDLGLQVAAKLKEKYPAAGQ